MLLKAKCTALLFALYLYREILLKVNQKCVNHNLIQYSTAKIHRIKK